MRVYHEDVDTLGVVYYANILRYMERARTEWLRAQGFAQSELAREHRAAFVVASIEVDYLGPTRFDELLSVGVKMQRCGRAGFVLAQHVSSAGGELRCKALVKVACVDIASFRPRAIPSIMLARISHQDTKSEA